MSLRIGHGYDAHCLVADRRLVLAGVDIVFDKGLAGHSDADVVIHALCDAILGAMGLGDIGCYFPNTSEFKDIDSRILLTQVIGQMQEKKMVLSNVDITIIAQKPRLQPYIGMMKKNLAADLCVNLEQINIKASTTDYMGFTGRGEGIACHVVVLLDRR